MRSKLSLVVAWAFVTATGIVVTFAAAGNVRDSVTGFVAPAFHVAGGATLSNAQSSTTSTWPLTADRIASSEPNLDLAISQDLEFATNDGNRSTPSVPSAPSSSADETVVTTATTPASTTTTAPPAAKSTQVETYSLVGGTVTVEAAGKTITLLGAVPKAGFTAREKDEADPGRVVVEFRSEAHSSMIVIKFDGGKLVSKVAEEPRG